MVIKSLCVKTQVLYWQTSTLQENLIQSSSFRNGSFNRMSLILILYDARFSWRVSVSMISQFHKYWHPCLFILFSLIWNDFFFKLNYWWLKKRTEFTALNLTVHLSDYEFYACEAWTYIKLNLSPGYLRGKKHLCSVMSGMIYPKGLIIKHYN